MKIHLNKNILHFFVTKPQKVANFKLGNRWFFVVVSKQAPTLLEKKMTKAKHL